MTAQVTTDMNNRKELGHMSTRERILTIRLMDMAGKQPEYMAALGIEVVPNRKEPDLAEKPGGGIGSGTCD